MELERLHRYRRQMELVIWLLLGATFAVIRFTAVPAVVQNQTILNHILAATAIFTVIYYHLIFPRFESVLITVTPTIFFTLAVAAMIHFSGSLTGVFFPLLFVPLMVTATMLGTSAFLLVLGIEAAFVAGETYFFQTELLTFATYRRDYVSRLEALCLVAFFGYLSIAEFFRRETERQKIEDLADELARRKKQDEAILRSIGDGVFAVDKDLKIVLFNQAAEELTGFPSAEAVGQTCRDIFRFRDRQGHPICQQASTCLAQKCFRTERVFDQGPLRTIRRDGSEVTLSETTSPVKNQQGVKLEVLEPRVKLPKITADREKIREVLENLLSNAVKFTPRGTVTVSFKQTRKEIIVAVTDTGVGIPADKMDKLFTKFYRVGQAPTAESEGTGLGLYIAKSLVELHQGRMWVESQIGQGSTFYFGLPRT